MQRWAEHFKNLFNDKRSVQESSLNLIPQKELRLDLDVPPSTTEIEMAIVQMKSGKSPGRDGIPAEIFQNGGDIVRVRLESLFAACWKHGMVPQDFKDSVFIPLYKNKGIKSDCSNYRGITLLSVAGTILARVLLNRLTPILAEENTP